MIKRRYSLKLSPKRIIISVIALIVVSTVGWYGWQLWDTDQARQLEMKNTNEQATDLLKAEEGENSETQVLDYASAASVYADAGEYQKARDALLKGQELCDQETNVTTACNPGYNELIGDMYQQLGDEVKAREYWQKALADYKRLRTAELTYAEDITRVEEKR